MEKSGQDFVRELFALVHQRRSFGRHPIWRNVVEGRLPKPALQVFAAQFFLQVREFPRALSALHSRCASLEQRRKLAESLYEEETGAISGSAPHPELFIRFGVGLGMRRDEMTEARPLPSTAALTDWFELATRERSFAEGIAAINVAAEGQVPGNFAGFARAAERHYGLTPADTAFFDVHEIADREHSDVGDNILCHLPLSAEERSRVRQAAEHSLELWWQFFDGIERARG